MPEQLGGLLGPPGVGGGAPEHDAAGGGRREDVSSSVDAVGEAAGPAGEMELQRVDRCRGGVPGPAAEAGHDGETAEREEHHRAVAEGPGEVERTPVGDLGRGGLPSWRRAQPRRVSRAPLNPRRPSVALSSIARSNAAMAAR